MSSGRKNNLYNIALFLFHDEIHEFIFRKDEEDESCVLCYALKTQGMISGSGSSNCRSNGLITLTNFYPKKNELFSKFVLEITTKCILNHLLRNCRNGGCGC